MDETILLDAYIHQKEMEQGKNYTDKLGMPVYAIRDSILDFIGNNCFIRYYIRLFNLVFSATAIKAYNKQSGNEKGKKLI